MASVETYRRAFPEHAKPMLSYGIPFPEACRKHVDEYAASRVYIVASGTLSRTTDMLKRLQDGLGDKVVGTRIGMKSHSYMSESLEVLHDIIEKKADCIVTLGGGSLADAVQFISFAEANGATTREKALALPHIMNSSPHSKPSRIPIIFIPTTLSGGEYSKFAGITDEATNIKYQYTGGLESADLIILSGELATTTPLSTWVSSGVRSCDHCIEALCSLIPMKEDWPLIERACIEGLQNLVPGLLATVNNPHDAEGRFKCQLGVNKAMVPLVHLIYPGASHGIGHLMGPMGVEHGKTSCVLMTAVHKYNKRANEKEQIFVVNLLWSIPEAKTLFESKGLKQGTADLGDLLDCFVRALGMPRTLAEVGIVGEDRIRLLAKNSMQDPCVNENPVKITDPEQFYEILQMCK